MRMKPIFLVLVALAMAVMARTFILGWTFHYGHAGLQARDARGEVVAEAERDAVGGLIGSHFIWGMISGVTVCLVHSIVLTYFVGTGKAIKEQMELQAWGDEEYLRWKSLMARALYPTSAGIVLVCVMAFSGGFTMIRTIPPAAHLALVLLGLGLQIPIFMLQWVILGENRLIMDQIVEKLGGENVRIAL